VASLFSFVLSAPREIPQDDILQGKAGQVELVQTSESEVNLTQDEVFQGDVPKDDALQGVKSQGQTTQVETVQSEQPQVSISSTFYEHLFHMKVLFAAFF